MSEFPSEPVEWFIEVDGALCRVHESKVTSGMDWEWRPGHEQRIDYGKRRLRRITVNGHTQYYCGRLRVPRIVWALLA